MKANIRKISASMAALGFMAALVLTSCSKDSAITPSNNVVTQERSLAAFTGVSVGNGVTLALTPEAYSGKVKVLASDNVIGYIETYVENGTLIIKRKDNVDVVHDAKVYVSLTDLQTLKVSGISTAEFKSKYTLPSLNVEITGASKLTGECSLKKLSGTVSGRSVIKLAGDCNEQDLTISGSSEAVFSNGKCQNANLNLSNTSVYSCSKFVCENVTLNISGDSDAWIGVDNTITINASGESNVYYWGNGSLSPSSTSTDGSHIEKRPDTNE